MVHTKNLRPASALEGKTPHELMEKKIPAIDYLRILRSIVYVFIHKANCKSKNSKAAKFALKAQRGKLVGYDRKIIYRVYLNQNQSVIQVKNLSIHKNANAKENIELFYNAIQTTENATLLQAETIIETASSPQTINTLETALKAEKKKISKRNKSQNAFARRDRF